MKPGEYNFIDHTAGDTFLGIPFAIYDKSSGTNVPVSLIGAVIKMQIKLNPKDDIVYKELSTDNSLITIVDAVGGRINIESFNIDFPAGKYFYDIQITFSSGKIRTYIAGTWNILQDITK